ncbi:MAG: type II toxin-antitoxin system RelE/ParE family toxin [Desulfococcaceae bacterium]
MYKDVYHPQVKKDLKKLNPALRSAIKTQYIQDILCNPGQGELLVGDLNGIRSCHLTFAKQQFRIAYAVEEQTKTVYFLMIGKRGEFYTLLKRRIRE